MDYIIRNIDVGIVSHTDPTQGSFEAILAYSIFKFDRFEQEYVHHQSFYEHGVYDRHHNITLPNGDTETIDLVAACLE